MKSPTLFKSYIMTEAQSQLTAFLKTIPKFHQRQDSTNAQLTDLREVANKLGMYDAADLIRTLLDKK